MKFLIAALGVVFAWPAVAADKMVRVNCQQKVYRCTLVNNQKQCAWRLLPAEPEVELALHLNSTGRAYKARFRRIVDGHCFTLDLTHDLVDEGPIKVRAEMTSPVSVAETSGSGRVELSLHDGTRGRGFVCPSIRLSEYSAVTPGLQ